MIINASANGELDLFVQPFIPKDLGGVNILKKIWQGRKDSQEMISVII